MASEHSGGAKAVTVTKLSDSKAQPPPLAADNVSKVKLVAPVAIIPTTVTPGPAVLVKDALASVTQSAKATHVPPSAHHQGKRVILTPLQTAPTSSLAAPPTTSSSALLASVHSPHAIHLSNGDQHRPAPHLRPVPPLIQDAPPPLQSTVLNEAVTDSPVAAPLLAGGGAPVTDHSYAAREPLATPIGTNPDHTSMSDSAEDLSSADSPAGAPPRPGLGPEPNSAPPKLLKKRGRPPSNSSYALSNQSGAPKAKEGPSSSTPSTSTPKTGAHQPDGDKAKRRGRGCGGCPSCLRDDCGICRYCKDKPKFGGLGKKKQRCALRICSNFVTTPGNQRKKQKPAPILPRPPQTHIPPLIHQLEPGLPPTTTTAAEKPQSNKESVTCVLPMEVIQQPLTSAHTAVSNGPIHGNQSTGKPSAEKAVGVTLNTEHPVVAAVPSLTTKPCTEEVKPVGTAAGTGKTSVMENGAKDKRQQSKTKEVPTEGATEVVFLGTSSDKETVEDSSKDTVSKDTVSKDTVSTIAGDKTEPTTVVAKVPRTRSQVGRERSQSVSSPVVAEKVKVPVKPTVERKRRTLSYFGELKMKCLFCGRQRKQAVARSEKFCTQRCIQQWSEAHPGEDCEASEEEDISDASPVTRSKKPANSRELKNLQIDMALPGKTPPHAAPQQHLSPHKPLSPRSLLSPRPATSPAVSTTTTAPTVSSNKTAHTPSKAASVEDTGHAISGTKRPSFSQPEPKKKPREGDYHGNSTAATTMVLPISAPPLTRTVPPPPVSIMHMNQIPSLANALSNLTEPRSHSRGLSSNIRNWSVEQVVQYFESTQDCRDYAEIFQEQDVDGTALLLLTHESLVKCLGIKLGRALKIMLHVDELKKFQESSE